MRFDLNPRAPSLERVVVQPCANDGPGRLDLAALDSNQTPRSSSSTSRSSFSRANEHFAYARRSTLSRGHRRGIHRHTSSVLDTPARSHLDTGQPALRVRQSREGGTDELDRCCEWANGEWIERQRCGSQSGGAILGSLTSGCLGRYQSNCFGLRCLRCT